MNVTFEFWEKNNLLISSILTSRAERTPVYPPYETQYGCLLPLAIMVENLHSYIRTKGFIMKKSGFIKQSFSTAAKLVRTADNVVSQVEMATFVSKEEERSELIASLIAIGWSPKAAAAQAAQF